MLIGGSDRRLLPVELPRVPLILSPFVFAVVLQLLAYHVGMAAGFSIDVPRHMEELAKKKRVWFV